MTKLEGARVVNGICNAAEEIDREDCCDIIFKYQSPYPV